MKRKEVSALLVSAVCAVSALAEPVYVWTGAIDSKWTEPGNWTVKGSDPAASPTAAELAAEEITVEFGAVTSGRTVIDLDGVGTVSNIVIVSGAPKYTFGTSTEQVLAQSLPGGRFEVEEGAAAPHLVAGHGWTSTYNVEGVGLEIVNNSDDVIVFDQAFYRPAASKWYTLFSGTGDFRIDGTYGTFNPRVRAGMTGKGRLVWNAAGKGFEKMYAPPGADSVLELTEGVEIRCGGGYYKFAVGETSGSAEFLVTGAGSLRFEAVTKNAGKTGAGSLMEGAVNVAHYSSITFDVAMYSTYYEAADYYTGIYMSRGRTYITHTNEIRGPMKILGENFYARLVVDSIGFGKEVPSMIGYADVVAAGGSVLCYTGPGEVCDRSFYITNKAPVQANADDSNRQQKAQIWHDGTGPLVWQGVVDAPGMTETSTLLLGGSSAFEAEFDTVLADTAAGGAFALTKTGAGTWRLTKPNTYSGVTVVQAGTLVIGPEGSIENSSGVSLEGGSLTVEGGDTPRTVNLPAVTLSSGDATLLVTGATTLSIASFTRTGGTVDIIPDDDASVKLPGLAGETPSGLYWKGGQATVDAEGNVIPADVTAVTAKGDEIESGEGTVAVLGTGTGENTSLAADDVEIGALHHMIRTPAVIAISDGQTLTTGEIKINSDSGDLTVGEEAGEGILAGASDALALSSDSPDALLKVNAAVAEGTTVTLSGGEAELGGGTVTTAGLVVAKGVMRLTGEETLKFDSIRVGRNDSQEATLVLDGAKDVRFGNGGLLLGFNDDGVSGNTVTPVRMIITNSTLTSCADVTSWEEWNDDAATFVIGRRRNAIVEVQHGSLVSNNLCVGVIPVNGSNIDRWYSGVLRQTGGEVRPVGDRSLVGIGGRLGSATYLMEGGLLQPVALFGIGNYSYGTLDVRGGLVVYPEYVDISQGNGSISYLIASGGKMTVEKEIRLIRPTNGARSTVVLEKDADVRASQIIAYRPGSVYSSVANIALAGGVLTVGGVHFAKETASSGAAECNIGFNGGTMRISGTYNDVFKHNEGEGVPSVTVYAGGCTIDTDGKEGNYSTLPFEGASGKGVAGVTMPEASYTAHCAPTIVITGDGHGATAVPVWDCDTLTFSGVRIVQPGFGYTWAKITAYKAENSAHFANVDCELADNVNTGSFTKKGDGMFLFETANSYGGDTVLAGGVLRAEAEGAIPSGSTVVFAGGTLALGEGVSAPTLYAADYAAAAAATPSTGGYAFPEGATITVRNVPEGDLPEYVNLLGVGADYDGPLPEIDLGDAELPKNYTIGWTGGKLRIWRHRGLKIVVR